MVKDVTFNLQGVLLQSLINTAHRYRKNTTGAKVHF